MVKVWLSTVGLCASDPSPIKKLFQHINRTAVDACMSPSVPRILVSGVVEEPDDFLAAIIEAKHRGNSLKMVKIRFGEEVVMVPAVTITDITIFP